MRQVPIYKGQRLFRWARVSEVDYERLVQWKWTATVKDTYASRWDSEKRKAILMHREVMGCRPGDGLEVDHWDGDGFNNMRSNLRLATRAQQMQNTRVRSRSGYKGVTPSTNGRWRAQGKFNGKVTYLGTFDSVEQAAAVAAEWRRRHHRFGNPARDVLVAD